MRPSTFQLTAACALLFCACGQEGEPKGTARADQEEQPSTTASIMDPHSCARPEEAVVTHLDLDLQVDMSAHRISGTARYALKRSSGDTVRFDTDGLSIRSVKLADGSAAGYVLGDTTFLGRTLSVELPEGADTVVIEYATGDAARALQWLSPEQTADKSKPFLFTQGQAILTRSWIPVQDSPGIRFTYNAKVTVPKDLMAVMSAENAQVRSEDGVYTFRMDKPIPAYLIALAVGDIAFKPIDERTGIYAEKTVLDKAVWEFADMGKMVTAAEELYGPYRWGRYDVIVLPPSFPFGGMENPMLTFATPTIIAGDRSLTALIAHELAHSWSGNLVTNANWNDFWLNEGFTVYFEHRISEKLYGADYSAMTGMLGHQDLVASIKDLESGKHPEDTRLKLDLVGRDPDDGMTDIAYEKGYGLLRVLESKVGREKFDAFLRGYFDRFSFQSMTTERFITYLKDELLKPNGVEVNVERWIYQTGLPDDDIVPDSDRFVKVDQEIARWASGKPAKQLAVKGWSTFEWMHFVRHLPAGLDEKRSDELDQAFHFTDSGNAEILAAWLEQCVKNDYGPSYERLDSFLNQVGRRKFLIPLYEQLITTEKGRAMAMNIYAQARPNYHSVSVRTIDDMLGWSAQKGTITL
ncbi:MAG: M1 family metallopeptidase [Flavobacteriales bacterium]|nr:M1 family metallopeptidase [Flavobacteriales bacterium]